MTIRDITEIKQDALRAVTPLNWRELLSIKAMTSFVAHNQNIPEDKVRAYMHATFDVNDIESLRREDFDRVIAFLVDFNCEMMMN